MKLKNKSSTPRITSAHRPKFYQMLLAKLRTVQSPAVMRSRFWLGQRIILKAGSTEKSLINRLINRKTVRQLTVPREAGFEMAMHCAQEHNNLTVILPELFDNYAEQENDA